VISFRIRPLFYRERAAVFIEEEAGWATGQFWKIVRSEKSVATDESLSAT